MKILSFALFWVGLVACSPCPPESSPDDVVYGDVSWVLTSTALVLFMTPGLAFYYSGLVRKKNVVNTLMMSYVAV